MNLKELTKEEVDTILKDIEFKLPLYQHQKVSILFCMDKLRAGIFSDVGTGKTSSALCAAQIKGYKKIFVVCPNSVKYNWAREVEKFTDYSCRVLEGNSEEKRNQLFSDENVLITNYESLRWILEYRDGSLSEEMLKGFGNFELFILDEIHKIKNSRAIQSRLCRYIGENIKDRIGLTGTPLANSLFDLFNVFLVLDRGETLGRNFYQFRNRYFNRIPGYWADDWEPKEDAIEVVSEKIKPVVIRYSKEECLDLPDKVYEIREVELSSEQYECLRELEEEYKTYVNGKEVEVIHASSLITKMSQITGGSVISNGEILELEDNTKMQELMELIEEIPGKICVFCRFVGEGRMIEKQLKRRKIKYASLRGEIKDKDGQVRKFTEDKNVRIMVAHPASGGTGINLHVSSTIIFYSNTYSYIDRYQAEGRIHRIGQESKCLYIDLIAKNTVDEGIYEMVMAKKELSDCLLNLIN